MVINGPEQQWGQIAVAQSQVTLLSSDRGATTQTDTYSNGTYVLTSGLPEWFSDSTTNSFVPYKLTENSTHLFFNSKQIPFALKKSDCTLTIFDNSIPLSQNPSILITEHFYGLAVKQVGGNWREINGIKNIPCTYSTNENVTGLYLTIQRNQANWGNLTSVYSLPKNGKPDVSNWFTNNNPNWATNYKIDFVSINKNINLNKFKINSTSLNPASASGNGWNFTSSDLANNNIQFVEQNSQIFSLDQDKVISDIKNILVNYNGTGQLNVKIQYGKNTPITTLGQIVFQDPTLGYLTGSDHEIDSGAGSGTSCPTSYAYAGSGVHSILQTSSDGVSTNACSVDASTFDLSSIPTGSSISSTVIKIKTVTNTNARNCDWVNVNTDARTATATQVWNAIMANNTYVVNDSTCTLVGTNTITLGSQANTDVKTAVASGGTNYITIGSKFHSMTRDGSVHFSYSNVDPAIQLQIVYTLPPAPNPITMSETSPSTTGYTISITNSTGSNSATFQGVTLNQRGTLLPNVPTSYDLWHLDGNLTDRGSGAQNLTANSNDYYTNGYRGTAWWFNNTNTAGASNNYFTVGGTSTYTFLHDGTTSYTIAFFSKTLAVRNNSFPIFIDDTKDGLQTVSGIDINESSSASLPTNLNWQFSNGTSGKTPLKCNANNGITDTKWHSYVFVFTSGVTNNACQIYIDGVSSATGNKNGAYSVSNPTYHLSVGDGDGHTINGLDGYVDELTISKSAWTSAQVLDWHQHTLITKSFSETGLSANNVYTEKLTTWGYGGYNNTITNGTFTTLAGVPTTLAFKNTTNIGTTLTWVAPTGGNATITAYKIERSPDNITWSTVIANSGNSTTKYMDSGLKEGTLYYYRVSTINGGGTGSPSISASVTTIKKGVSGGGVGTGGPTASSLASNPQTQNTTSSIIGTTLISVTPKSYQLSFGNILPQESFTFVWNSTKDVYITSTKIGTSDISLALPQLPLLLKGNPDQTAVSSSSLVPFALAVPQYQCSNTIQSNCANQTSYQIPITFTMTTNGQTAVLTSGVYVQLQPNLISYIPIIVIFVLSTTGGIVLFLYLKNDSKKRNKNKSGTKYDKVTEDLKKKYSNKR